MNQTGWIMREVSGLCAKMGFRAQWSDDLVVTVTGPMFVNDSSERTKTFSFTALIDEIEDARGSDFGNLTEAWLTHRATLARLAHHETLAGQPAEGESIGS